MQEINADSIRLAFCGDVKAGFPVPPPDKEGESLDLVKMMVKHPAASFFFRVSGVSMVNDDFDEGDIILVDRAITPYSHCVAVCFIDGEFTLKRVQVEKDYLLLMPANPNFPPIRVTEENQFWVWGVVTYVIKKV